MSSRRIIIVGGVAGGATAAARARRISEEAEIIVLERGPYVSFSNCGLPYHVGGEIANRDALLLQTPENLKARYNIDVRVRSEVLSIDRAAREVEVRDLENDRTYRERYDKLILSPGAAPLRPPLPGIDHPRVFSLRTVPDMDRIKIAVDSGARSAVVVGGGFIGLEMVENLRRRGLTVHLVELLDQVMPPLDREMATAIHQTLKANGVDLRLGDAVESFSQINGQLVTHLRSGTELAADLVILSIGVRPESDLARKAGLEVHARGGIVVDDRMRTSDPDILAVGDAVVVKDFVTGADAFIPLAGPANRQGRIAADNALGRESVFRGTQGTSIVRVFDLAVGMTGASEKSLAKTGLKYEKIYVHPAQHVGYFPGSRQMSIKLLFARSDGRVLGAQITGGDGVDKRIDVLATAIQAGMTVFDLEEIELAYAPQFGAAKDPINMAGFVAANVMRGDAEVIHADGLEGQFILDVRNPSEHEAGAIPGATLIPLHDLRRRHGELPSDRSIAVYCAVGMRGYLATRLLGQLGYKVRNISGGYRTYCAYNLEKPDRPCRPPAPAGDACGGAGCSKETPARTGEVKKGGNAMNDSGNAAPQAPAGGAMSGQSATATAPPPAKATIHPDETLDVRGKCCPGPIVAVADSMNRLGRGEVLQVLSSDHGFVSDIPAWCRSTGNELISAGCDNGHFVATIRKGAPQAQGQVAQPAVSKAKTLVIFSNDLDRVLAAFIIANGAAAMGQKVTLFFTFWGLNVLRRSDPPAVRKTAVEKMFGWMMPRGPQRLKLSKMNMGGAGTAMMKGVMKSKGVDSLPALIQQVRDHGVRLVACAMSMDVMGIKREELMDGVEMGGVAAFLAEADESNVSFFI